MHICVSYWDNKILGILTRTPANWTPLSHATTVSLLIVVVLPIGHICNFLGKFSFLSPQLDIFWYIKVFFDGPKWGFCNIIMHTFDTWLCDKNHVTMSRSLRLRISSFRHTELFLNFFNEFWMGSLHYFFAYLFIIYVRMSQNFYRGIGVHLRGQGAVYTKIGTVQ